MTYQCRWALVTGAVLIALVAALPAFGAPAQTSASVTIHVLGSDGQPIPGAIVGVNVLKAGTYRPLETLTANAAGVASTLLKAGSYRFDIDAESADPETVYLSAARGGVYDFPVTLDSYGSISGVISDTLTGLPTPGAVVAVTRQNADGSWPTAPTATVVAVDGAYTTGQIAAGTYRITADASGYASGFYDSIGLGQPSEVVLATGAALTGIDISLTPVAQSGRITGSVVSGAARTPYYQAIVFFYRQNDDGSWPATSPGWGSPTRTVETNGLGAYDSGELLLGSYRVRFFTVHTGSQWWQYVTTVDAATPVSIVTPGQTLTGIDGWYNKP